MGRQPDLQTYYYKFRSVHTYTCHPWVSGDYGPIHTHKTTHTRYRKELYCARTFCNATDGAKTVFVFQHAATQEYRHYFRFSWYIRGLFATSTKVPSIHSSCRSPLNRFLSISAKRFLNYLLVLGQQVKYALNSRCVSCWDGSLFISACGKELNLRARYRYFFTFLFPLSNYIACCWSLLLHMSL